jgi:hypothetical protein
MAKTPDTVALQKGAVTYAQPEQTNTKKAVDLMSTLLSTPTLPTGTSITPTLQTVQTGELQPTSGVTGTVAAATPTAPTTPTITGATAPTAGTVTTPTAATAGQMTAAQVGGAIPTATAATGTLTQPMTAQTGAITADATVRGQLEDLQSDVSTALASGTAMPVWARGAAEATRAAMQSRGMGASSMMAEALAEGIMKSAVPIAAADAATYKEMIFKNLSNRQQTAITNANSYFQMDMANLSNNQQTSLANLATRQAFLLSDQGASNAAAQFNATSTNQVNQFYDGLIAQVGEQNATRADAMSKFANEESNKISAMNAQNTVGVNTANANRQATINQFNATLDDARQRFNSDNQRVIDQSNAQWRRALNTANTAATNATNQLNAQNMLDLSNYAVSALWQQWRDEADWVNSASDNALSRSHNAALAALERTTELDLADEEKKSKMYELLGKFGIAMVT